MPPWPSERRGGAMTTGYGGAKTYDSWRIEQAIYVGVFMAASGVDPTYAIADWATSGNFFPELFGAIPQVPLGGGFGQSP